MLRVPRPSGLIALVLLASLVLPTAAWGAPEDEAPAPPAPPPPTVGNRVSEGLGREGMWPAPTAEDWAKPVLIQFQRTWDDAVRVSKETGKPILICINMDGEIASEHYAGVRYRQPEAAKLYEPYVCVIASVYRHNPRDHDDEGNRILCPRFGCVTCGEHIAIEPTIFEKYCDGRRIAPRHIAVDLEKSEVYDVYYIDDTAGVFDKIRDGVAHLPPPKPPIVRGDRPILERVASAHIEDRLAVEAAYRKGDPAMRKALLEAALKSEDVAQLDLLRMAIFGLDVELSQKARAALAKADTPAAITLISESLQVPMSQEDRDKLIAALRRMGDESTLARWLSGVHAGLYAKSRTVDPSAWSGTPHGGASYEPATDSDTLSMKAEEEARRLDARPTDPDAHLDLAETCLAMAVDAPNSYPTNQRMARRVAEQMYEDARKAALDAEALGASGWRVDSTLAVAAYYTGDVEEAYARAARAMEALPGGDTTWRSMALVTIFAEARWKAIKAAVKERKDWPGAWLADLHAAYAVLQRHPLGTADQVVWHYDFLVWLGANHRAAKVLREGLTFFPLSVPLHAKFRQRMMKFRGVQGVEEAYEKLLVDEPKLLAFAGLASFEAAEQYRRMRAYDKALGAYERSIGHYGKALADGFADRGAVDHAIALALAGRARVQYQMGDNERALADILASYERGPDSAGTRDGMGFTPGETGQMLLARFRAQSRPDLAAPLEGALADLDPQLLTPDIGLLPRDGE